MPTARRIENQQAAFEFSDSERRRLAQDVKNLSRLTSTKTYVAIATDWLIIAVAIATSIDLGGGAYAVIAAFIIAGRQHALLVLMHEGAHRRISTHMKWNDWVSDYLIAYPIFMDTRGYREHHLQHHRHLNTDKDPDWVRKIPSPDWQFPMKPYGFAKTMLKYLYGYGVVEWWALVAKFSGLKPMSQLKDLVILRRALIRFSYYAAVCAIAARFGHASYVLTYWLFPYVFVMLVFQRIRSVAEHFGLAHTHELNKTRNVLTSPFEAFFIGPHNVCYHLDHHMFPTVPFYNLEELHARLLQSEEYRLWAHQNTSYVLPTSQPMSRDLSREYRQ